MGEITTLPITTRKSTELPASSAVSAINHIVAYEGAENVRIPLAQLDTYVVDLVTTNAPTLTAAQIKSSYESNANTNEFSDSEQSKLAGIEANATTDQTAAQIKASYESNANTNEFSDAEQTKLAEAVIGINNISVFTSSGSYTKPAGIKSIKVTVIGGGGGGLLTATNPRSGGAGGGASFETIPASSLSASTTVTVGAGGSGTGGTSSFGAFLSATGGSAGAASNTGVAGGVGVGGVLNLLGSRGVYDTGGVSIYGGGGKISSSGASATNATSYGAGGGPAASGAAGLGYTGLVLIEEFF
jgi:hypothetical protein